MPSAHSGNAPSSMADWKRELPSAVDDACQGRCTNCCMAGGHWVINVSRKLILSFSLSFSRCVSMCMCVNSTLMWHCSYLNWISHGIGHRERSLLNVACAHQIPIITVLYICMHRCTYICTYWTSRFGVTSTSPSTWKSAWKPFTNVIRWPLQGSVSSIVPSMQSESGTGDFSPLNQRSVPMPRRVFVRFRAAHGNHQNVPVGVATPAVANRQK